MEMCSTENFSGCAHNQSGQRFLDSSAPRLIRHVSTETAGGGDHPSPAGKDEKLSREFEGGALIGREAPVPPLLDENTNNRHTTRDWYVRPKGRGKHCGRFSIKGRDAKSGRPIIRRVNCNSWTCSYCGPKRARLAKWKISTEAEKLGLRYFWTLTLPADRCKDTKTAVRHIRKAFNHLREYLRREHGQAPDYICVMEFTQKGIPHLHVLFDRRIEHSWMSDNWHRLGAGYIVWVKQVTANKVARYLSKYLTKGLLLSAPKGTRRITTSRTIKLFQKMKSKVAWEFIPESIWSLLTQHNASTFNLHDDVLRRVLLVADEDGFLLKFEIVSDA